MKLKKIIFLIVAICTAFFSSCREEQFSDSIFETGDSALNEDHYAYEFNKWLDDSFLSVYNLDFRYRMQDVGTDVNYNLVPTKFDKAVDMALLVKYLWFDAYAEAINPNFLREHGPRIIHLIGSPAYNPVNGTIILGLAEGGIKVSLFRCNEIEYDNIDMLNEYYFKTMHHEFSHILHQKKMFPKEFNLISSVHYEPFSWQERDFRVTASLGFVSPYGSSETREDFVETIANYIVKSDEQWEYILETASKGWEVQGDGSVKQVEDDDDVDGKAVILRKLNICRTWLKNSWDVDLDKLREEVQTRQNNIDMEELRKQIYGNN